MAGVLSEDNATARGIRTGLQAFIGFIVGLALVVWAVPGVPDAVWSYITSNLGAFLLTIGVPSGVSGIVGYIWSRARGVQ